MSSEGDLMLSLQPIIINLARRLERRFPELDVDELVGASQPAALNAVRTYKRKHATALSSYAYKCVWSFLTAKVRYAGWRRRHSKEAVYPEGYLVEAKRKSTRFNLYEWLFSLSNEAQKAVCSALEWEELLPVLKDLRGLDLEKEEIVRIFQEVRDAL